MKNLGKYQLLEELGQGPAGAVYRALDPFRNNEFALKVLASTAGITPEARQKLYRDLTAAAELQVPQMVKIQDLGDVDGTVYVARELLTGLDLRRSAQERPTLSRLERLKLMAQVCEGLTAAHRKQIAHGNLKPSNIFVVADGDARILDFGMANVPPAEGRQRLPNYVAPEQILGQPFDARSDVFALAVIAYEFLSGAYPFQAQPGLIPREIVHTEPAALRKLDPEFSEELERLFQRALDKNPQTRLQTAEEFGAGLFAAARAIQSPPPVAVPVAVPEPVKVEPPKLFETPKPVDFPNAVEAVKPPESKPLDAPKPQLVKPAAAATAAKPRSRVLTYVAAAVLGISIVGLLLSRQNSNASPTSVAVPDTPAATAAPAATPAPVAEAPKPVKTEQPAEAILSGPVTTFWEQGQYAQAMKLVDSILARHPNDADAKEWKKKIREAQDAEAAIK